jgi:hypothetical protein
MKYERLGNKNPNAIAITWDGLYFPTSNEFYVYARTHGMNLKECREILK